MYTLGVGEQTGTFLQESLDIERCIGVRTAGSRDVVLYLKRCTIPHASFFVSADETRALEQEIPIIATVLDMYYDRPPSSERERRRVNRDSATVTPTTRQ